VKAVLEGHSGNVNCAEFCPHYTSTVVSAADDRTFRVRLYWMWQFSLVINILYTSKVLFYLYRGTACFLMTRSVT